MKSLREFKNRPTFNIALRICNDAYESNVTRDWLETGVVANLPLFIWNLFHFDDDIPSNTYADLFYWAWEQVDWEQVAEAVRTDTVH